MEVLVAGAILSVGLLGIANMMITAINANSFARKMSTAKWLAEERIEKYRNLTVLFMPSATNMLADQDNCIPVGTGSATDATVTEAYGTITNTVPIGVCPRAADQRFVPFQRVSRITLPQIGINNVGVANLTVQVFWRDTAQNVHSVTLNTMLSK